MCLLLYLSFRTIIQAVATTLPNWHIPGFGRIRDWVMGAIDSAWNDVKSWTEAQLHPVAHLVSYPVNVVKNLFRTLDSLWHITAVTLAFIVGTKIPAILRAAMKYADRLYNAAVAYTLAKVVALAQVVELRYQQAVHWADRLYNAAVAYTLAKVLALANVVELRYQQAVHWADRLYNAAVAYTLAKVLALAHVVELRYQQAVAWTNHTAALLVNRLDGLYQQATRYADAAARAAATALLGTLNGA